MYCYRFPSEAVFLAALAPAGLLAEDGSPITASHTHALDVIGLIYVDGVALPGWHVNTAGIAPESWDQYLVVVNSASRIFFGGPAQAPGDDVLELIV